jgi:hypothetical protein
MHNKHSHSQTHWYSHTPAQKRMRSRDAGAVCVGVFERMHVREEALASTARRRTGTPDEHEIIRKKVLQFDWRSTLCDQCRILCVRRSTQNTHSSIIYRFLFLHLRLYLYVCASQCLSRYLSFFIRRAHKSDSSSFLLAICHDWWYQYWFLI